MRRVARLGMIKQQSFRLYLCSKKHNSRRKLTDIQLVSPIKVNRVIEGTLGVHCGQIAYVYTTPQTDTAPTVETANGTKLVVKAARKVNWTVRLMCCFSMIGCECLITILRDNRIPAGTPRRGSRIRQTSEMVYCDSFSKYVVAVRVFVFVFVVFVFVVVVVDFC